MNREVVIAAYGRSAVCRSRKGAFAGTHPIEYSAQILKGFLISCRHLTERILKMSLWAVRYSTIRRQ